MRQNYKIPNKYHIKQLIELAISPEPEKIFKKIFQKQILQSYLIFVLLNF